MLEAALWYREQGFSVIPVSPALDKDGKVAKKAILPWAEFQKRIAGEEEIISWWLKNPDAMVAIVTGNISDVLVIDCDSARAYEKIQEYIPDSLTFPLVNTPRGGRHLWFKYPKDSKLTVQAGFAPDTDYRGEGGYIVAPPSLNGNGKNYEWIIPLQSGLPEAPANLVKHLKDNTPNYKGGIGVGNYKNHAKNDKNTIAFLDGLRDESIFHVANSMTKGGMTKENMRYVLGILARNCDPPYEEKDVEIKIESALKRAEMRERNLSEEVKEFYLLQGGYTNTTNLLQTLQITTPKEKKNVTVIQNRLVAEGIIEKHGQMRGCYRPIEKKTARMKFIQEPVFEFPVKLPFGIHDLCRLYPKNIAVIAGAKSAGKTTFMLDIALRNQDRCPVIYLNSEMGEEEWSERLKLFGCKKNEDVRFEAIECSTNFQDEVGPEKAIYLIDFLEVHENFWEVAKPLRLIHEKLKDGIAIVAIQKKFGERLGRGADFSMEKSRLYLTLDYNKERRCSVLTIEDAKSPKVDYSIRGFNKKIKIMGGSKMEALDGEWLY